MKVFKNLHWFSKRVINLRAERVTLTENQEANQNEKMDSMYSEIISQVPKDWELMKFDQLCSLSPQILKALELEVNKQKFSVDDNTYRVSPLLADPLTQLNHYWANIYKTFNMQSEVSKEQIKKMKDNGNLSTMFLAHPFEQPQLQKTIQKFIDNIKFPQKLQGIAQPTFAKYLLGLRRDLLVQGADIDLAESPKFKEVRLIQILNYQHEFWADVKQNRSKNGTEGDYIFAKKNIDNPNSTITLTSKYPKVDVLYITRKKKRNDFNMNFCHKIDILIEVESRKHIVRVEKLGFGKNLPKVNSQAQYLVIDFDRIFKGNPTIRPIFQF